MKPGTTQLLADDDTIHMLWIGGQLSTLERLAMASFLANGHRLFLHAYNEVDNVPPGVTMCAAEDVLPESSVFQNTGSGIGAGGFAGFSDWFRYELLSMHRGWWCDTDLVCLAPFRFDQQCIVATSREKEWGTPALGCAMRFSPSDPLLLFCRDFCRSNNIAELVKESYTAVGPGLLQEGIRRLGLQHYQAAPDIFCPISWRHTRFCISSPMSRMIYNLKRRIRGGELVERIKPESKGLHLWHSTWSLGNFDKNATFDRGSIYETLKRRYLEAAGSGSQI